MRVAKPKTIQLILKGNEEGTSGKDLDIKPENLQFDMELFTPEVQRQLADFVNLIGRIRSQRENQPPQSLDNGSTER